MITVFDSIRQASSVLRACGIEDADREAELIFRKCMGIDKAVLYRDCPEPSAGQSEKIANMLEKRSQREPLHYIAGHIDFYGLNLKVGQGVLIPRPETELLVEHVINTVSGKTRNSGLNILDLCTGSGCIALALAKHFPEAHVYGTDISDKALMYAKENAETNHADNAIFLHGSLFEPVKGIKFDIITANPPYIRQTDISRLQPEIREWEPLEALDAGEDGLRFYREIVFAAWDYLKENGRIFLEIGQGQADSVKRIADDSGYRCLSVIKDYAGIERHLSFEVRQEGNHA